MQYELSALTKEARAEATRTAMTHYVVLLREPSKCGTFEVFEYDIFQSVDEDDPDVSIVRVCSPDYAEHQKMHGLNDHLFGQKNCPTTR